MALVTLLRVPAPTPSDTSSATAASSAGEDLGNEDYPKSNLSCSESFVLVRGAARLLQQGDNAPEPRSPTHPKNTGDLSLHLQAMINTLRCEDIIKLAVRLESKWAEHVRYMVVVYTKGCQDMEENALIGMDFTDQDSKSCTIGLAVPLWSDTDIHLDGGGGFSISTAGRCHVFKPVSVKAMWSALQVLYKACEVARHYNYYPGSTALSWVGTYESCISSEQSCISEWNAMTETTRPDSPDLFSDQPAERERAECLITTMLNGIMVLQDLENITAKEIRTELEQHMKWNLREYNEFIDKEMLLILDQMDKATPIFDHLYLGSEWNASNLEDLRHNGIGYILNMTQEVDNFFPGTFCYYNVRVYDDETADLLAHWNDTYNFIVKAKQNNSKCLVHCKMGVSRSVSTVIAYTMKEHGWPLAKACSFVKQKRSIAQPSTTFLKQLAEYEAILGASKQQHNKLWQLDDGNSHEALQAGSSSIAGTPQPSVTPSDLEPCEWGCEDMGRTSPRHHSNVPSDHLNYNYYFRRLSDTALDSEPSTPVRGPPLLGMERVYIEIEDVERDALLDDSSIPTVHLAPPGDGTAAQTCGRLEPLEDMRLRLEFSTVLEEDEEEAQKEEAEMAALARGRDSVAGQANPNRFSNENANNSNRLSGKRSCPSGSDDSASSGNPHKVKPSYYTCRECPRLLGGRRGDRRTHRLNFPRLPSASTHAPGAGPFGSTPIPGRPAPPVSRSRLCGYYCRCPICAIRIPLGPAVCLDAYRQHLTCPVGCEELPQRMLGPADIDELQKMEEEEEEKGQGVESSGQAAELALLKLSLQCERSTAELSQEAHLPEGPHAPAQPETMELGADDVTTEDMEVDSGTAPSTTSLLSTSRNSRFCPVLPLQGHALTQGRGPPSLVQLRAQEIETRTRLSDGRAGDGAQEIEARARLAGLTTPSRLKRSNSLAKLGGLAMSPQDLACSTHSTGGESIIVKKSPSFTARAVMAPLLQTFPS
ncbi:protein phosphatase Slingshot homolog 1 [Electrophorus electricus]|uniref:protein phosphatase Slingshot homolog 1 n=1 Tax=Electrophorus electricus TaxID=8005 RepID=UPI0015CFE51E|nr:protein phosphatase Slingshot homolog 1 [Electrophorus electricus]